MPAVAKLSPERPAGERPLYRLSVRQYETMIAAGILGDEDPVELIEGLLVRKMPQLPPHATTLDCAQEALRSLLPGGYRLREQKPIALPGSRPEPDLAVVRGSAGRYAESHPGPKDIAFVAEVADTTLAYDRAEKARIYARGRIPVYWIINVIHGRVEVYSGPKGGRAPAYRRKQEYGPDDAVPVVIKGREVGRVAVRDLFPPSLLPGESE